MLLAMLYDTRSIQLVKENIESGIAEGVTYAVELMDVFLSEQLKQQVIPVIDDLSVSEKNETPGNILSTRTIGREIGS
ncbi:MAG: hypothetical protein IPJ20_27300 [Flammeovirgaceae bacterium]|nr:hypothetical protein [Flammeovirgaceae bacterium]